MLTRDARRRELQQTLEGYDSSAVYPLLAELGSRHTTGPLQPMAYDSSRDYHQLSTAFLPAQPIPNEVLAPFGPKAHPNFSVIPEAWRQHQDLLAMLAIELRHSAEQVTLITNHSNVIDIALVLGALRLELEPWLSPEEFTARSALVISRGITTTNLHVPQDDLSLPAVEVLQFFTNVALSFPTTPTVRSKTFPEGLVQTNNALTKLELADFLEPGGRLLAIAPSASRDVFFRERVHMQPLKSGTMQLMRGRVIPVAVTLDGEQPAACRILEPRWIEDDVDCHRTMHEIAEEVYRQTLVPTTYHEKPTAFERAMERFERRRGHI